MQSYESSRPMFYQLKFLSVPWYICIIQKNSSKYFDDIRMILKTVANVYLHFLQKQVNIHYMFSREVKGVLLYCFKQGHPDSTYA